MYMYMRILWTEPRVFRYTADELNNSFLSVSFWYHLSFSCQYFHPFLHLTDGKARVNRETHIHYEVGDRGVGGGGSDIITMHAYLSANHGAQIFFLKTLLHFASFATMFHFP